MLAVRLVCCMAVSAFTQTGRRSMRRFGGLLASAVLFLLGGGYLAYASAIMSAPRQTLIGGMLVMGWNVARYGRRRRRGWRG
jgi:hypothetical protein